MMICAYGSFQGGAGELREGGHNYIPLSPPKNGSGPEIELSFFNLGFSTLLVSSWAFPPLVSRGKGVYRVLC